MIQEQEPVSVWPTLTWLVLGEDLAEEEFVCASDELKKETSIYLLITYQNDASTGVLSVIRGSSG